MAVPAVLPLALALLLAMAGPVVSQKSTTTQPVTINLAQTWAESAEDGLELRGFTGDTLPDVPLQQGLHLRIADSHIQTLPENAFSAAPNVTNATLEIVNTTVREWGANSFNAFTRVSINASRIERLNASGIHFVGELTDVCRISQHRDITVSFDGSSIGELAGAAINLSRGRALLSFTNSTLSAVHGAALRLGRAAELRVQRCAIGSLTAAALCRVCAYQVTFTHNQLAAAPPHSLQFGSEACEQQWAPVPCRRRSVAISGNRLPCSRRLLWLRDALASCGSLRRDAFLDFKAFGNTSSCADRPETVAAYLALPPSPPLPPPRAWWHREDAAGGIVAGLALGFLALGLLVGCFCCHGASAGLRLNPYHWRGGGGGGGGGGASLPMERMDGKGTKAADDRRHRPSPSRYETSPVHTAAGGRTRTRARTPEPITEQTYVNPQWATQPAAAAGQQPGNEQIYVNPQQQTWSAGYGAPPAATAEPVYVNQQQSGGQDGHADQIYANHQGAGLSAGHESQDQIYANHQGAGLSSGHESQDQIYANRQGWGGAATDQAGVYENLHRPW